MATIKKNARICDKGHTFYKSTDCPTCPICEQERKPHDGFLSLFSAPARRALESRGITSPEKLSEYSEKEVLRLHGIGPGSLPQFRRALAAKGLFFKQ